MDAGRRGERVARVDRAADGVRHVEIDPDERDRPGGQQPAAPAAAPAAPVRRQGEPDREGDRKAGAEGLRRSGRGVREAGDVRRAVEPQGHRARAGVGVVRVEVRDGDRIAFPGGERVRPFRHPRVRDMPDRHARAARGAQPVNPHGEQGRAVGRPVRLRKEGVHARVRLLAVGPPVIIGVWVARIAAQRVLVEVVQPVLIRVQGVVRQPGTEEGPVRRLPGVGHAVAVCVPPSRVCSVQELFQRGQPVAVMVAGGIGRIERVKPEDALPSVGHAVHVRVRRAAPLGDPPAVGAVRQRRERGSGRACPRRHGGSAARRLVRRGRRRGSRGSRRLSFLHDRLLGDGGGGVRHVAGLRAAPVPHTGQQQTHHEDAQHGRPRRPCLPPVCPDPAEHAPLPHVHHEAQRVRRHNQNARQSYKRRSAGIRSAAKRISIHRAISPPPVPHRAPRAPTKRRGPQSVPHLRYHQAPVRKHETEAAPERARPRASRFLT